MDKKLKIGLVGLGHLGKIHLKCLLQIPEIELVCCYDANIEVGQSICKEHGITFCSSYSELIKKVDAVDIVTPTSTHFELAKQAVMASKHCFIEKPVTQSLKEAETLELLQKEYNVKIQVGHVERYNPSFLSVFPFIREPKFIEAHRLSPFNPRGTDVSVVHDLMIHDLDLISLLAKCEPKEIRASGLSLVSRFYDICNARIEFENGLVANVTASRISMKQMRKLRIFQEDAYISLDLAGKEVQVITLRDQSEPNTLELDTYKGKKFIKLEDLEVESNNAILDELKSFSKSILQNLECDVTLQDGIRALRLVEAITKQIN